LSANDKQTVPLEIHALREYATQWGWAVALQVREISSGASRELREKIVEAARQRDIDVVLVWWPGWLRPGDHGPADNPARTGASRRGPRIADRGAGPDRAGRSSRGRAAARIRGILWGKSSCRRRLSIEKIVVVDPVHFLRAVEVRGG
jgi:hypothetical protein